MFPTGFDWDRSSDGAFVRVDQRLGRTVVLDVASLPHRSFTHPQRRRRQAPDPSLADTVLRLFDPPSTGGDM